MTQREKYIDWLRTMTEAQLQEQREQQIADKDLHTPLTQCSLADVDEEIARRRVAGKNETGHQ